MGWSTTGGITLQDLGIPKAHGVSPMFPLPKKKHVVGRAHFSTSLGTWGNVELHSIPCVFFPCSLFISLSNGVYYGILDVYHVPVAILVPLAKYPVHLFIRGNWVRGNWVREVCYCCQYWFARWEIHIPSIAKTNRLNLFGSECHLHSLYQTKPFLSQQQIN